MNLFELNDQVRNVFAETGYIIFNIRSNDLLDKVNADVDVLLENNNIRTNSKIYSYNNSPRLVESWRRSESCRKLAKHPRVLETLRFLYGVDARPFSTINFLRSTQQPLHSDYVHFGTVPELQIAGVWIALEDINPDSGPLTVVPGSHTMPIFEFERELGVELPKNLERVKKNYSLYESWVRERIELHGFEVVSPEMKKGDCIVWSANLLHGSPNCIDASLSRRSQVTHYDFMNVELHYNPNFSSRSKGRLAKREVSYF